MSLSTAIRPRATLTVSTEDGEMSIAVAQIPIDQAARSLGVPAEILNHLVNCGVLDGDRRYCDVDQAARLAEQLAAARAPVEANPILVSEAAEKYGFSTPSIYKWIAAGWVKVLQPEPRVLVNEGDMAFARSLANLVGHTPGRAVFPAKPRSGRPRKERE